MNKISKYFGLAAASLLSVAGFSACQDHFDNPEVLVPVADIKPNTTIEELKTLFWNDSTNYCHQIGVKENGDHYIIAGRVTSSDYDGNIFKTLYIQDETAPLSMSINQYNLYLDHRIGQELVMDLTGMYIGKYNGMMQLGAPSWFERDQCITTSFMAPELFNRHTQLNGLPDLSKVDTVLVADFSQLGSSKEELIKWQGQLVRFNNAKFANAGNGTLVDEYHSSGYNQSLNVNGGSIDVRTSGYAKFWNMPVPAGNCDVVGMLGYFNGWQLVLNDAAGIMEATVNGDREHPYTVAEGIEFAQAGTGMSGWVSGYIVGAVAPEVTEVKSNSDIQWTAPFVLANTLVIADSADCRDYTECLILELPEGSLLQSAGNLADNEGNLGKKMGISGRFVSDVYTTYGVTGYDGRASEFFIEGVDLPEEPSDGIADGDGSKESPYSPAQVMALGNPGTTAWVKGYIVGSAADKTADSFTTATGASASGTNIFIAATADETDYNKCLPVQLPAGAIRAALNLQANPGNLGMVVTLNGSLEKYFGLPGVKTVTEYELDGQGGENPEPPVGDGDGTEDKPYVISQVVALGNPGTPAWVKGYIVGSAADKTADSFTTATGASASGTNIFIAATADETDYNKCLPVQLPVGDVRAALNLQANPGNLGKEVVVYGSLEAYFGLPGIKSVSQYKIDGQGGDTPVEPVDPVSSLNATFEGVTAISQLPGWSLKNVIGNKSWYFTSFEENSYAAITGYKGTSTDGYESWLITPPLNFDAMAQKVLSFQSQAAYSGTDKLEVFVMTTADPSTATLSALECHIAEPPATGYSGFEASGEISLESFSGVGYIGFRYTAPAGASGYRTYCIDNVVAGQSGM